MNNQKTMAKHILVVEDSATQAMMLREMLEELGMQTSLAVDLKSAQELLRTRQFDAIMLDLILPDSAGIETIEAVVPIQSWTPIVVLTSLEDENLGYEALKVGADEFVVKGASSPQDLARSLRYAIERKRQSSRVYESEKRLRTTIDNSYDAFISFDENMQIVDWNIKAEELFGYTYRDAIGMNLANVIFPQSEGASVITELKHHFSGKQSEIINRRCETIARHRGGREFPAEVAFFSVVQGQKVTLCSFVSDVTDRKAFEKHASEFYSTVAHELRSPLTSIKGSLSLLNGGLAGPLTPDANELVTVGSESCERLIRLINDLLDLSKFEAGKMPLTFVELTAEELITRAAAECSGYAANYSVSIVKEVDNSCALIADQDRMLQVLINLLSNALKFSPKGGTVIISAKRADPDKVRLAVKDNGPGISKANIEKLFEKFQQVQGGEEKGGTGLGLAICKAIVSHHKGAVGVDSEPGEGATFWLELPRLVPIAQASLVTSKTS